MFNISECGAGYSGWHWRDKKRINVEDVQSNFAFVEIARAYFYPSAALVHAHLLEPDVGECYPHCDDFT